MRRTIHRFEIHQDNIVLNNDTIENTLKLFDQGKFSEAIDGCYKFLHTGDVRILLTLSQIYQYGLGTDLSLNEAEHYLKMAAAQDSDACFQLAEWYEHGINGEPDHQKAYQYYTKGAQQNHYPSMLKLASIMNNPEDPQYSPENAFMIYKIIADDRSEQNPEAEYNVGKAYLSGIGVDKNPKDGFRYISLAVRHNYLPAIYELGIMYIEGNGVLSNTETAFKLMNQAAAQNYPMAQYQLGKMYEEAIGTFPNGSRAYNWYSFALSLGCEKAAARMAGMLLDGNLVHCDYDKARALAKNGVLKGDAESMRILSRIYGEGLGIPKDEDKAAELIKKAAEKGSTKAQRIYGMLLFEGKNSKIEKNIAQAIEWCTRAANAGDRKAQYFLGKFYSDKNQKNHDYQLAKKWYLELVEKDERDAMYYLGKLYAEGKLSEKADYSKARYYYVEASHLGQIEARFELAKLYHYGTDKPQNPDEEQIFEKDNQLAYYYAYLIPNDFENPQYQKLLKEIENGISITEKNDIQQQARMQMLNQVSVKIQRSRT